MEDCQSNVKPITASEARSIADAAEVLIKRVYKAIKESAKESMTRLDYSIFDPSQAAVAAVAKSLESNGYTVTVITSNASEGHMENTLRISW